MSPRLVAARDKRTVRGGDALKGDPPIRCVSDSSRIGRWPYQNEIIVHQHLVALDDPLVQQSPFMERRMQQHQIGFAANGEIGRLTTADRENLDAGIEPSV